jgi:hypothetical protein
VNMRRLIRFMTVEIGLIRAGSESRRHAQDCSRGRPFSRLLSVGGYALDARVFRLPGARGAVGG